MKKPKGREVQISRLSRKVTGNAKKGAITLTRTTRKIKVDADRLLSGAKKKLNKLKTKSSKKLRKAKVKVYATEKEILDYVKAHPVKSGSAVALVGLIAGFIAYQKMK